MLTGSSSTPHAVRVSASDNTSKNSEAPLLRGEIEGNVRENIDFKTFVRGACKLPDEHYQKIETMIRSGSFGSANEWKSLVETIKAVRPGDEKQLYAPLIQLYDWTYTSATPLEDSPARRKPDLAGFPGPIHTGSVSWKDALVCWEVKHDKKRLPQTRLEEPPRKKARSSGSRTKSYGEDAGVPLDDGDNSSAFSQLASYLLEMISAQPHRRHTFGVLLCQWQLKLVCHTRSFIAVSEPIDIRRDQIQLTVAIAALWTASLETLGFHSQFVRPPGERSVRPEGCRVTISNQAYPIDSTIFSTRALFGRGSAAFLSDGAVRVVIKISCPPKTREVEGDLLERAKNIPNIIRLEAKAIWGDTRHGFGPEFIEAIMMFEVREFRVLALSPVCEPFTSITDLEVFKESFRKLVVAHHELYKIKILHCDISARNMMYDPVGREPYLIDVDLGKSVDRLALPSSNHRTGTLPFMATDLLVTDPPPHLYRHDLESFFYVLIWMCAPDHCGWDKVHSITAMREKKSDFFTISRSPLPVDTIILNPRFEPLKETWIRKLYLLFLRGRQVPTTALFERKEFDTETLGGSIQYTTFIAELSG
ncbi:hypothetical protein FRC11_009085 [Ceratobasidium sp. 423]|nr:hypothetical protein FRC11_009085 [Ceratobasidium sp. 423]